MNTQDRLTGTLLGTALGDALGLPMEGLPARVIERRFGLVDRFHLLGTTGYVSDDTEQSALVAQTLLQAPSEPVFAANAFRRSLVGWFWRLPWGIGLATLRACFRAMVGLRPSGVRSAGNGAAMRSAVIGATFADEPESLVRFSSEIARVTHTDARAVDGAVFVAALAGACALNDSRADRFTLVQHSLKVVNDPSLRGAIESALAFAEQRTPLDEVWRTVGNTGFVLHTIPLAVFCFVVFGDNPLAAISQTISAGGDTDSIGAIVGAWVGALHGESGLPAELITRLHDGPFGPTHLRALGHGLAALREGKVGPVPQYSAFRALVRNLALFPIIIGHGIRRIVPV